MREVKDIYIARLKRRILVGCLTAIIGVPCIGGLLVLLLGVVAPALQSSSSESIPYLALGGFVIVLLLLLAIPIGVAFMLIMRRSQQLDTIFEPLGLKGSPYLLYGRQYHGQIAGRSIDVYIYRGPTVEFWLSTGVQTRFQVFFQNSLPVSVARTLNKPPVPLRHTALEAFAVYAEDENWVCSMFSLPQVIDAVRMLMTHGAEWAVFRRMELQPGKLILHLYRSRQWLSSPLDEAEVRTWLMLLQNLAESVEQQPPQVIIQPSGPTRQSRQRMNQITSWTALSIIILLPLCAVVVGVLAYLFASMQ